MRTFIRGAIGMGPKTAAALAAVPRTKSGEPDKRYAATKKVLAALVQHESPFFRRPPEGSPFEQEVSRRRFPLAIRPVRVVRADGSWMDWDRWLKSPDVSPFHSLIFEDGSTVHG
jgi:hypothetical protein